MSESGRPEIRILHVESGKNLYGGAAQVFYLLQGLRSRQSENLLVCDLDSEIGAACREAGFEVRETPIRGDLDFLFLIQLVRIIRAFRPDVVHLHSRRGADVIGAIAGRLCRVKVVLSRRVDNPESRFLVWLKYRLYHRVIAISDGIRRLLIARGLPESKVSLARSALNTKVFPEPVSIETFRKELGLEASHRTIAVVAQMIPRKGQTLLLEILPWLLETHPELRVVFFGKGSEESRLKAQARKLGVDACCRFAGFRADVKSLLPHVDILAHPAYMEGLGISMIEAAYCGLPIVACSVGGIPEIVRDGENGYLIPPGDASALEEALRRLLDDPDLCQRMGRAGREIVQREFEVDCMVESNLAVYQELVGERS